MRPTFRAWLVRMLATSEPSSVLRMTEAWLAIGLSSRIGSAAPAQSALPAGSAKLKAARLQSSPACTRSSASEVQDQPGRALDAVGVIGKIHAALETVRGVAREVVAARAPGDGRRKEESRFEEQVPGRRLGLGRRPAHDAGEADRPRIVG